MKKTILFSFLLFWAWQGMAQNPSRVTIRGVVKDTTDEKIAFSTVMLLQPKDSTLINFTRSDENGAFSFKNVKNTPYILKISYVGYLPL